MGDMRYNYYRMSETVINRFKTIKLSETVLRIFHNTFFMSMKISKRTFLPFSLPSSHFIVLSLVIYHSSSYFITFMGHNDHYLQLSETGGIYRFRTWLVWDMTRL